MSDRDQEEHRDPSGQAPPEDPTADETQDSPTEGPAPATWAGRRRSTGEAEGKDDEPQAEEPAEAEEAGSEASDDGGETAEPSEPADDEAEAEDTGPDTAERVAQDTVESDTLALGDREAAREAALAGLRARAAEHGTKPGTESIRTPPPKTPAAEDGKSDGQAPAGQAPPTKPPTATAVAEADEEQPRRGLWPRFVAGSFLIIAAMATATAVSLFFFLNDVLAGFRGVPAGVQSELTIPHPGQAQTILIIGSDHRPGEGQSARSDTTILLRVASDQITVMSIPRDLKTNIPGHGLDKFNAAYTYGGQRLTLKTVKQLTGITDINHIVNVDFTGFANAVNAIGCVYVDVDHHYYHSNYGLPASEQYAEIDIPAGYQRMCGLNALSYVRYRHDDNDLVRSARQQDFLRELRQELPASRIFSQYNELVGIAQKYVTLDIRNSRDLIALAQLVAAASSAPVVQVPFPANLGGPTAEYVTYNTPALKQAVAKFEGETPEPVPGQTTTNSSSNGGSGGGSASGGGSKSGGSGTPAPAPTLIDVSSTAQQTAATLEAAKTEGGSKILHFPLYYPTRLAPDSTLLTEDPDDSRAFLIDGPGNEVYHGYKFVASMLTDGYTAYYGVSGTDWKDPPILDHPDETRTIDGRDYLLSWDGPHLRLIGWKTDEGSYWVDNTLLNALTPGEMFAIAESMQKYTG